jgi:hypothetical protein
MRRIAFVLAATAAAGTLAIAAHRAIHAAPPPTPPALRAEVPDWPACRALIAGARALPRDDPAAAALRRRIAEAARHRDRDPEWRAMRAWLQDDPPPRLGRLGLCWDYWASTCSRAFTASSDYLAWRVAVDAENAQAPPGLRTPGWRPAGACARRAPGH